MASRSKALQVLRIIAGQWRGRKLRFPDVRDIRPTPDRVRETLFNWLMSDIAGARCLDVFAGSGALGLEALSRGADKVVFVDQHRKVTSHLNELLQTLEADNAEVIQADAMAWLCEPASQQFDIVFLDPPYAAELLVECCQDLEGNGWLADNALIYIEHGGQLDHGELPDNWSVTRSKKAGQVYYELAQRT